MTKKLYLKFSETPFLFGNRELIIDGKTYYVKHNYDDNESALNFARELITKTKRNLENKSIKVSSW